jgi:hypothetical protein
MAAFRKMRGFAKTSPTAAGPIFPGQEKYMPIRTPENRSRVHVYVFVGALGYFFFNSTTLPSSCFVISSFSVSFVIVILSGLSSAPFFMVTINVSFSIL